MIGNKYLQTFYKYTDEDTGLNQLLELLKSKDKKFITSLKRYPVDIEKCSDEEIEYLTKTAALIDYYLQLHNLEVPEWLRNEKLKFERPYYHSKRLSDFDKFRLIYTNPAPFRTRNVYYDLEGICRI